MSWPHPGGFGRELVVDFGRLCMLLCQTRCLRCAHHLGGQCEDPVQLLLGALELRVNVMIRMRFERNRRYRCRGELNSLAVVLLMQVVDQLAIWRIDQLLGQGVLLLIMQVALI